MRVCYTPRSLANALRLSEYAPCEGAVFSGCIRGLRCEYLRAGACVGVKKNIEKGWEVLDTQGEKAVNYKLPAKTAGALFDRQREGKKARRMRRHISLPN